ncbi:hypothetical protein [Massilia antarctica]|uniref:hypothetical protein n=1 Tax=Massilia antarctica TaxID=2765360 RepID=UPI0006BB93DD|nr:hypothetical protein [Massilia sp. H27-R4]MCY0913889.1 hypothetical protein [Massilia sp. H27-R4]CUI04381.1 hypothetical protein BN2497_3539 [Janthinobacterium sp. CG23_2]CUU28167.1 hypothetical protein BN3177_3539 [Janthinobacterium sp. CG23_2]
MHQFFSGYGGPDIEQAGTANKVFIDQSEAACSFVRVGRAGTLNDAWVRQNGTTFTLDQSIVQLGERNVARADESGQVNGSTIVQTGNENLALATSTLNGSVSEIIQAGRYNRASAMQIGALFWTTGNFSSIRQTGNSFSAKVLQNGSGNLSLIDQR